MSLLSWGFTFHIYSYLTLSIWHMSHINFHKVSSSTLSSFHQTFENFPFDIDFYFSISISRVRWKLNQKVEFDIFLPSSVFIHFIHKSITYQKWGIRYRLSHKIRFISIRYYDYASKSNPTLDIKKRFSHWIFLLLFFVVAGLVLMRHW